MPAYLTEEPPWFVFLVHPRDVEDLHAVPGGTFVAQHSATEQEFVEKMSTLPPTVIGTVRVGFTPVRGEVTAVLCMPGEMMRPKGRAGVAQGAALAVERGSKVIGLGALTAPATRGGIELLPLVPRGVTITTGNAYTAAIAHRNALEAVAALGSAGPVTVAVVGCTGSVGVATSRLLARSGLDLVLIGRTVRRVWKELPELAGKSFVSDDRRDVGKADVTLLLTGDVTAQLTPAMPKPGSIVIDFSHPFNIPLSDFDLFRQRDIRISQGGLVVIPGHSSTARMRLPDRHCTLACLAETYLFAREGIREHSVGHAKVELADELERLAAREGLTPRSLGLDVAPVHVAG